MNQQELSYKAYVTDVIRAIAREQRVDVSQRWYDTITGPVDTRPEAEVALDNFFSDLR